MKTEFKGTKISKSRTFDQQLSNVPDYIRKKTMFWVYLVESQGIREVRKYKGYHDEGLKGLRLGQRSVRLNKAYRLIYKEIDRSIHIMLLEVNKHDY